MTVDIWIFLIISVVALAASALFSLAEVAVFSVRQHTLDQLMETHTRGAEWLKDIFNQPRKYLVTILFGNIFSNATMAYCVVSILDRLHPDRDPQWVLSIVFTVVPLIFLGELLPKAFGSLRGRHAVLVMAGWLRTMEHALHPLLELFDRISQKWVQKIAPVSTRPIHGLTENEYLTLLDIGTREGSLRPTEKRLVANTIRLANRNVREIMTPRNSICSVNVDLNLDQMRQEASKHKHRRLPIFSDSLDTIVGILNTRCFLAEPGSDMMAWIEPPSFVPETMKTLDLLKNFLKTRQHMALVVDEFGGVEGLITLEDIMEEIFGEIHDEYDDDSAIWEDAGGSVFKFKGLSHLNEVSEILGVELEAEGIDTLSGWLMNRIGEIPRVGDQVNHLGFCFLVEKIRRNHVSTVLVWPEKRKGK